MYFKGLDELRAIAAFAVVFHHLELFKKREGKFSLYDIPLFKPFISNLGHNGVICFFVLSGFLITYLLLIEKKTLIFDKKVQIFTSIFNFEKKNAFEGNQSNSW